MNGATYKVWMVLFDNPHVWLSAQDIAHDSNLTRIQVQTALRNMPSPPVYKDMGFDGKRIYMIDAPPDKLKRMRYDIICEKRGIPPQLQEAVIAYLRNAAGEWVSLRDIVNETGGTQSDVYYAVSAIPNVQKTRRNRVYLYRMVE